MDSKLNIILDSRLIERYHPLMNELETQDIDNFELWPCIILPSVVKSINSSHKMIVRDAMEKGLKECYIGEDDLMFTADDGWEYFLMNKPKDFDLYLSSTYIITDPLQHICGFHLYCVHEKFYERFLSVPDESHIDSSMNDLNGNYHFCYPFPALQRAGFSSNNRMSANYNSVFKDKEHFIYKGK